MEAVGRGLARAGFLEGIDAFMDKTRPFRQTYNLSKRKGVNRARAKLGLAPTGVYDARVHAYLNQRGAFDAYAVKLFYDYTPPAVMVNPVLGQGRAWICQGPHETGGLKGYWAYDLCAGPGTGIAAVERGVIDWLSGRDPNQDTNDGTGTFGWSVYVTTPKGYRYYVTHLGWRPPELERGLVVQPGDLIGRVGDQDFRPDHVHYAVASPLGRADAIARMTRAVRSPRAS